MDYKLHFSDHPELKKKGEPGSGPYSNSPMRDTAGVVMRNLSNPSRGGHFSSKLSNSFQVLYGEETSEIPELIIRTYCHASFMEIAKYLESRMSNITNIPAIVDKHAKRIYYLFQGYQITFMVYGEEVPVSEANRHSAYHSSRMVGRIRNCFFQPFGFSVTPTGMFLKVPEEIRQLGIPELSVDYNLENVVSNTTALANLIGLSLPWAGGMSSELFKNIVANPNFNKSLFMDDSLRDCSAMTVSETHDWLITLDRILALPDSQNKKDHTGSLKLGQERFAKAFPGTAGSIQTLLRTHTVTQAALSRIDHAWVDAALELSKTGISKETFLGFFAQTFKPGMYTKFLLESAPETIQERMQTVLNGFAKPLAAEVVPA